MLPYNERHWAKFFDVGGREDLIGDERFSSQAARSANIDALYGIVAEVMPARTSKEWLTVLEAADIPVMPMNTPEDLFDDPHLNAVGMFPVVDHPTEGKLRHIKVPVSFSKTPGGYYRHPERLGKGTAEVLADVGFPDEGIGALQEHGAAGKPPE